MQAASHQALSKLGTSRSDASQLFGRRGDLPLCRDQGLGAFQVPSGPRHARLVENGTGVGSNCGRAARVWRSSDGSARWQRSASRLWPCSLAAAVVYSLQINEIHRDSLLSTNKPPMNVTTVDVQIIAALGSAIY